MNVKIKQIVPNPFRDLDSYPLRAEKIAALKASIQKTGFWDNLVGRQDPTEQGKFQIAYGHHRLHVLTLLKDSDDEIDLKVRDLDDTKMLQMMAAENMNEWAPSASVDHATVCAVVKAWAESKIQLDSVATKTPAGRVRHAPSFQAGGSSTSSVDDRPYTAATIATFLGWSETKVKNALGALELIANGPLNGKDFENLGPTKAAELVAKTRKARRSGTASAQGRDGDGGQVPQGALVPKEDSPLVSATAQDPSRGTVLSGIVPATAPSFVTSGLPDELAELFRASANAARKLMVLEGPNHNVLKPEAQERFRRDRSYAASMRGLTGVLLAEAKAIHDFLRALDKEASDSALFG